MTAPPTPQSRSEQYAIGVATLVSLLASRASYRLILLATTVLLLPVWGEQRYGTYAAAMASFSWLLALVITGPEKTILKLLPRAPRTGPAVSEALLAVLWWLPLPLAAAFVVVLLRSGEGAGAVYTGVAAMQLSIGCTMLLVGLHRAAGRPRADARTFQAMAVAQVLLLAAAVVGVVDPVGYLAAVIVVQLVLNLVLSLTLGRPSLRAFQRPRFLARLGWTAVLLGGTDLFLYATTAVLFTILTASVHADQTAHLYVVTIIWSAGVNLLIYVLRVYAPRMSLRLAGRAGPAGRGRAAGYARLVAVANLVWLVAVGLVLATTTLAATASPVVQVVLWAVLLATRAPAVGTLLWAGYLLENTDATAPRLVGLAGVTGLAVATVAGLAAVPAWGGVGVIGSLAVGELAYALVVAARDRPPGRFTRARREPAGEVPGSASRDARRS